MEAHMEMILHALCELTNSKLKTYDGSLMTDVNARSEQGLWMCVSGGHLASISSDSKILPAAQF